MASLATLLASDIPDPTDFPSSAPGLCQLDSALRCNICSELFEAPVTLPCGHCFCSYCVRSAISDKQECPNCRKAANECHIRVNPSMEEAVTAWKQARSYVLQLINQEGHMRDMQKEQRQRSSAKKRKRSPTLERSSSPDIDDERVGGPSRFFSGDGTRATHTSTSKAKQRHIRINGDKSLRKSNSISVPSSDPEEDDVIQSTSDQMVKCPLCDRRVRMSNINAHIDKQCPPSSLSDEDISKDRRSKKMEWSKLLGGSTKRKERESDEEAHPLPKASYAVLKDKQLKELLSEQRLPITGDRNIWIARHQRWVMLYNANLDRSHAHRHTTQELRLELKKWEEERKTKKVTINDVDAYQMSHKSDFAQLVEAARQTKRAPPQVEDMGRTTPTKNNYQRTADNDAVVADSQEEPLLL